MSKRPGIVLLMEGGLIHEILADQEIDLKIVELDALQFVDDPEPDRGWRDADDIAKDREHLDQWVSVEVAKIKRGEG